MTVVYALVDGKWALYVPGAPPLVNRPFAELYAGGLPPLTPLLVHTTAPPADGSDGEEAGN